MIGPAPILAAIVGLFHVSAYVFIRGHAGARLPLLLVAAWLGAWAGDTVGSRLAIDPLRIGEFNVIFASLVAWLAIGLVAIVALLVPERTGERVREQITTSVRRGGSGGAAKEPEAGSARPAGERTAAAVSVDPEPQAR
jgi:uncharacterized membrane protein YdjX (TVP38/TMEM64 family)